MQSRLQAGRCSKHVNICGILPCAISQLQGEVKETDITPTSPVTGVAIALQGKHKMQQRCWGMFHNVTNGVVREDFLEEEAPVSMGKQKVQELVVKREEQV